MPKPVLHAVLPAAIAIAVAAASPATAAFVEVFAPESSASAAVLGPGIIGSIQIKNGVVDPFTQTGGTLSTSSSPDGYTNSASATQPGFGNASVVTADLANGALHAFAGIGPTGPGLQGGAFAISDARIRDTVYFTNNSGTTQQLTVSYLVNGILNNGPNITSSSFGGFSTLDLFTCTICDNIFGEYITGSNGIQVGFQANAHFSGAGVYQVTGQTGQFTDASTYDAVSGALSSLLTASIFIPTGQTSLGVGARLALDCRALSTNQAAANCDFGNTGKISFGPLPTGLSFTSASGVFLAGSTTPGEVPIPAALFLMIPGIGALGAAAARRRRQQA